MMFQEKLRVPRRKIDAVLDTDAYNEVDDLFAIAYMLKSTEKINTKAIYAAPFYNSRVADPSDGTEKSYNEIRRLLILMDKDVPTFRGANDFLENEITPKVSVAAFDIVRRAKDYSPENPLYVVAIGALTNIASAILLEPSIADNIVIVWLGGHARHIDHTREFNMCQDYSAANVVLKSNVALVQLPCEGVVSEFTISKPELLYWLVDQSPLADYLARSAIKQADSYAHGKPWTKTLWDVAAVGWLLNDDDRFMDSKIVKAMQVEKGNYVALPDGKDMAYVTKIYRDALMEDMISKLIGKT